MADQGIATRCRFAQLDVKEVGDWKHHGREFVLGGFVFAPEGCVNHHTAGAAKRAGALTPSLRIVTEGRSDLPGPLCNVYQGYDDVVPAKTGKKGKVYVVAAGVANHAGLPDAGTIRGMTGNSSAYGLEIEHPGTSPIGMKRAMVAARIHGALLWRPNGADLAPSDQVVQHHEWAPTRKIDLGSNMHDAAHGDPTANGFRKMVDDVLDELNGVNRWRIEYEAKDGTRKRATVRDLADWVGEHDGIVKRGRFVSVPKKD